MPIRAGSRSVRIHRSKNRRIERDRDGRRRYSAPDDGEPSDRAGAARRRCRASRGKPTRRNRPPTRPCANRDRIEARTSAAHAPRPLDRADLGLAARADRVRARARCRRWRWRRSTLWPVLFLTFPVLVWLIDGAAAGRLGGAAERGRRRLVVRLRLFPRRPLLDRLRVPGRRQDLRLAAAVRGDRAAGRAGALHRASALRSRACSGRAGRCASSRSRSR